MHAAPPSKAAGQAPNMHIMVEAGKMGWSDTRLRHTTCNQPAKLTRRSGKEQAVCSAAASAPAGWQPQRA